MKYQIYLNKATSERINLLAQMTEQKASTFIKKLIEASLGDLVPPKVMEEAKELVKKD